jgi:hypothetical protein
MFPMEQQQKMIQQKEIIVVVTIQLIGCNVDGGRPCQEHTVKAVSSLSTSTPPNTRPLNHIAKILS